MVRRWAAPALVALMFLIATSGSASAAASAHLSGFVRASDGAPAAGAEVTLRGGNVVLHRRTDAAGAFAFYGLVPGAYLVRATKGGDIASVTVDLGDRGFDGLTLTLLHVLGRVRSTTLRSTTVRGSGTDVVFGPTQLAYSTGAGSVPSLLLQLPGAARGANGVVHINGDHGDVNYIVDGVPIPQSLDRQIGTELDPSDISFMEAIEGAYPAQYGDRFALTVNLDTKTGLGAPGFTGYAQAGSYGHVDQGLTYQTPVGSGALVVGLRNERGNWMLDPPSYHNLHNSGSNADQFARYTAPLDRRDYIDLSLTHSLRWYQISPDVAAGAPASTDDNEEQNESFAALQVHHQLKGDGAVTYGVAYNDSNIVDFNDVTNDLVYDGISVYAARRARDLAFNLDDDVRSNRHEIRWGISEDATAVAKRYQITVQQTDGLLSLLDDYPNIGHNLQSYLQDSWHLNSAYELDYGLRYDTIDLASAQFHTVYSQVSPRIKLTRFVGPRASIYAYYGRFFTPFAFENVDPTIAYELNKQTQTALAPFDLKPQRDSDYEIGSHLPLGRGELGLRVMQKNATDWIDDTEVVNTALFQNINYALGRVAVQGATYEQPLADRGEWRLSVVHTYAEDKGCETQLLAPCQGGNSQPYWAPADHDQRWSATSSVMLPDRRGDWLTLSTEYGSGLTTDPAQCSPATTNCKTAPHLIFDIEKGVAVGQGAFYLALHNALNDRYSITYLNAQGNHVGMPRDVEFGYRFSTVRMPR
jgi:hypothetical protein